MRGSKIVTIGSMIVALVVLPFFPAYSAEKQPSKTAPGTTTQQPKSKPTGTVSDLSVDKVWLDNQCMINIKLKNAGKYTMPDKEHSQGMVRVYFRKSHEDFYFKKISVQKKPAVDPNGALKKPGSTLSYNTKIELKERLRVSVYAGVINSIAKADKKKGKSLTLVPVCAPTLAKHTTPGGTLKTKNEVPKKNKKESTAGTTQQEMTASRLQMKGPVKDPVLMDLNRGIEVISPTDADSFLFGGTIDVRFQFNDDVDPTLPITVSLWRQHSRGRSTVRSLVIEDESSLSREMNVMLPIPSDAVSEGSGYFIIRVDSGLSPELVAYGESDRFRIGLPLFEREMERGGNFINVSLEGSPRLLRPGERVTVNFTMEGEGCSVYGASMAEMPSGRDYPTQIFLKRADLESSDIDVVGFPDGVYGHRLSPESTSLASDRRSGTFNIRLPADMPDGNDYVVSLYQGVWCQGQSRSFAVRREGVRENSLVILEPAGGELMARGSEQSLSWRIVGFGTERGEERPHADFVIDLLRNGEVYRSLHKEGLRYDPVTRTCSLPWTVPESDSDLVASMRRAGDPPDPEDYMIYSIRIRALGDLGDGLVGAEAISRPFAIQKPRIVFTSPLRGTYTLYREMPIELRVSGGTRGPFVFSLVQVPRTVVHERIGGEHAPPSYSAGEYGVIHHAYIPGGNRMSIIEAGLEHTYRLVATSVSDPSVTAESEDLLFAFPEISITSPRSDQRYSQSDPLIISWACEVNASPTWQTLFDVDLCNDSGSECETTELLPWNGSISIPLTYRVPAPTLSGFEERYYPRGRYRVRVHAHDHSGPFDLFRSEEREFVIE